MVLVDPCTCSLHLWNLSKQCNRGWSADIVVGAALFKKVNKKNGIVIVNIGDGALGCGPVWEALCLATMDQYKKLWEGEYKGGFAPYLQLLQQPIRNGRTNPGETMGYDMLARVGAGVNPNKCMQKE